MEVKFSYRTKVNCHPQDLWEAFRNIEDWRYQSDVFGDAGWVHGRPWTAGSRCFVEVTHPERVDLEVVVLKCEAPAGEIVLLSHGGGMAGEQWIRFTPVSESETLIEIEHAIVGPNVQDRKSAVEAIMRASYERWFDGLKAQAEKRCFAL